MTEQTGTHFLTDIEIKEFKCFKDFKASGFKRVNLIGGKNNVGKTAFMEAMLVNVFSRNINKMILAVMCVKYIRERIDLIGKKIDEYKLLDNMEVYKSQSNVSKTEFFITNKDGVKEYFFDINGNSKYINAKELNISHEQLENIEFIGNGISKDSLARAYQRLQKIDKEDILESYIIEFDESITKFKVIGGIPQCQFNGKYFEITEFGDGLKSYISIICSLYQCENGYLFIDEIDNGIYYDHLDRLWEIIFTLSEQNNCQVFATTHSKEMLESFARVAKKLDEQDISYTMLVKNKKQEIKTISLDYDSIIDSVINQGHEVR
jgi:AAA15 family ATPase/GTPase